ncbi:hypothetical protein ACSOQT_003131 [Yersinia enterocolitica]
MLQKGAGTFVAYTAIFTYDLYQGDGVPPFPTAGLANAEQLLVRKKSGDHHMILAQYS